MYNILVSFICHELPKWVLSFGYINKTVTLGLSHIHHLPLATISKIQIISGFRLSLEWLVLPWLCPQGLINLPAAAVVSLQEQLS